MYDLKKMALHDAIECIRRAKEKDRIAHQWREIPLSDVQQTAVRVEMDQCLDRAVEWIKAVIESEENEP